MKVHYEDDLDTSCYTAAHSGGAAFCLTLRTTQMVFAVFIQPYSSYASNVQVTLYATLLYISQVKALCSVGFSLDFSVELSVDFAR